MHKRSCWFFCGLISSLASMFAALSGQSRVPCTGTIVILAGHLNPSPTTLFCWEGCYVVWYILEQLLYRLVCRFPHFLKCCQPGGYGPSSYHQSSIETELRRSPRGTTRQKLQTRLQVSIQRRLVPEAIAHQAHLRVLIEIRRLVFGYHKRRKWTANSRYFRHDINQIEKTLRDEVIGKSKKMQNAWELMDKTGIGSQQLLTYI